jgi:hypothetical protein
MKRFLATFFASLAFAAAAQPAPAVPARAQAEIEHLFDYISASNCRFERNGSWHDMAAAREHVGMKYEYLRQRGRIDSAETFIEGAASKSSLSGQDYQVQCPGNPAIPAGTWLRDELARFRGDQG